MVRAQEEEQNKKTPEGVFFSGCGAVRLAYTAGGRVVAGSNPVIPTKQGFKQNQKLAKKIRKVFYLKALNLKVS